MMSFHQFYREWMFCFQLCNKLLARHSYDENHFQFILIIHGKLYFSAFLPAKHSFSVTSCQTKTLFQWLPVGQKLFYCVSASPKLSFSVFLLAKNSFLVHSCRIKTRFLCSCWLKTLFLVHSCRQKTLFLMCSRRLKTRF